MLLRTCVHPSGRFVYGLHRASYRVSNQREEDRIESLGALADGSPVLNRVNFPEGEITVEGADPVYEIANPFPFRGTTFISASWAESRAGHPELIRLPTPPPCSMHQSLKKLLPAADNTELARSFELLPEPVLLGLATASTDPRDLIALAQISCELVSAPDGSPSGLRYKQDEAGRILPSIRHHELFEVLVNNPHLPDNFKQAMVLRPGVQGASEIVGGIGQAEGNTHIYEYLRRNSYIPWGHYAANMAEDAIRYRTDELDPADIRGLRQLYYQRTYLRLAADLGLPLPPQRKTLNEEELESLRHAILRTLAGGKLLSFTASLWGWNYGFDFSPGGYRLHASHQQIHQQFALLPARVAGWHHAGLLADEELLSYGCGDQIAEFCARYRKEYGIGFFSAYLQAIRANRRMDGRTDADANLVVYEDERVILFVPKAQTSQWELQIMPLAEVGNILEADPATRASLDLALLIAQRILALLGARLVTSIEYPKRFGSADTDQRLLYALLPKLPYSMGAFSEAQLRWISGHFPEDFAAACRAQLPTVLDAL